MKIVYKNEEKEPLKKILVDLIEKNEPLSKLAEKYNGIYGTMILGVPPLSKDRWLWDYDKLFESSVEELCDLYNVLSYQYVTYYMGKKIDTSHNLKLEKEEMIPISNNNTNEQIYLELIHKYKEKQIIVAIEELSELQKELCKYLRDKYNEENLIEEIADVEIVLEQIKLYFNLDQNDIDKIKEQKIERTKERLLK